MHPSLAVTSVPLGYHSVISVEDLEELEVLPLLESVVEEWGACEVFAAESWMQKTANEETQGCEKNDVEELVIGTKSMTENPMTLDSSLEMKGSQLEKENEENMQQMSDVLVEMLEFLFVLELPLKIEFSQETESDML